MWAIHDDIRAQLKEVTRALEQSQIGLVEVKSILEQFEMPALKAMDDMIYKEENILFPMSLETLTEGEWAAVQEQSDEIGYTLIEPDKGWVSSVPSEPVAPASTSYPTKEHTLAQGAKALLPFETGALTLEQINLIFDHLPVDITFVDHNDTVRYFSYGKERIFQRSKAIIGRNVQNCHPPDSVHIVTKIVGDFKSGKRDSADFWIKMNGKFVFIQYFAVRNAQGEYMGTIEVTQDVQNIRSLEGEKRIYSEE
jgi:PAS domain S-box-containing protein